MERYYFISTGTGYSCTVLHTRRTCCHIVNKDESRVATVTGERDDLAANPSFGACQSCISDWQQFYQSERSAILEADD